MEKFRQHKGKIAVLERSNVDTDQIIPKEFLKKIGKLGYGADLFHDWRYLDNGKENPQFPLNAPQYAGASILFTGPNFGCGSSREHAVWALMQYGFKVIIGAAGQEIPAFADIFRSNSMKNGLLTIALPQVPMNQWMQLAQKEAPLEMEVDLEKQELQLHTKDKIWRSSFDFPRNEKDRFLKGLDAIALTLQHTDKISTFEKKQVL